MEKENPFIVKKGSVRTKFVFNYLNIKEHSNKIQNSALKNSFKNFYMTDIISNHSKIMAECSLFLKSKFNFIE